MDRKNIIIKNADIGQTLKYLGYGEEKPDKKIEEYIKKAETVLLDTIKPQYIYRVFDLDGDLNVIGADFELEGNAIKRHLKGCDKAVFLCATISDGVDRLIRKTQVINMTQAVIMDGMAGALVEQVCDEVEKILHVEFPGYNMTWRFGLGYDDFPLSLQKKFLDIIDAPKRTGVCVSESGMLTPSKSVTCIIGLSGDTVSAKKSCANCVVRSSCVFRARNERCYKKY